MDAKKILIGIIRSPIRTFEQLARIPSLKIPFLIVLTPQLILTIVGAIWFEKINSYFFSGLLFSLWQIINGISSWLVVTAIFHLLSIAFGGKGRLEFARPNWIQPFSFHNSCNCHISFCDNNSN